MKRNEIALLCLIVGIVSLASYLTLNSFLAGSQPKETKVMVADKVTADVEKPTQEVFGPDAYNPTVKVRIGDQSNQQPFN